jgi:hypothetical protein
LERKVAKVQAEIIAPQFLQANPQLAVITGFELFLSLNFS